jgi:hypothetical protein
MCQPSVLPHIAATGAVALLHLRNPAEAVGGAEPAALAVDCGRRIKPLSVLVGSTGACVAASDYEGSN